MDGREQSAFVRGGTKCDDEARSASGRPPRNGFACAHDLATRRPAGVLAARRELAAGLVHAERVPELACQRAVGRGETDRCQPDCGHRAALPARGPSHRARLPRRRGDVWHGRRAPGPAPLRARALHRDGRHRHVQAPHVRARAQDAGVGLLALLREPAQRRPARRLGGLRGRRGCRRVPRPRPRRSPLHEVDRGGAQSLGAQSLGAGALYEPLPTESNSVASTAWARKASQGERVCQGERAMAGRSRQGSKREGWPWPRSHAGESTAQPVF